MEKKCKIATVIVVCFLVIIAISGILVYFVINNSLNRHAERCVIRYLHDQNMLRDVTFEESPSEISFDNCDDAISKARRRIRDEIKIPCNLHDDKEFIRELEDLGMLKGIYQRINQMKMAIDTQQNVTAKIGKKCNGIRNFNE